MEQHGEQALRTPRRRSRRRRARRKGPPRGRRLERALTRARDAVGAGVAWLIARQAPDGTWRDFDTLAGPSDEWVTAYVARALCETRLPPAIEAARAAWRALRRRRRLSSGWGYARWVPPDADSTAWALLLADALGAPRDRRLRRARGWLAAHVDAEGGVCTFARSGAIRRFTRLARSHSFAGWCAAHTCVSALAATLPDAPFDARPFLRARQRDDGRWSAYWWTSDEYPTALAAEALAREPTDAPRVARAMTWLRAQEPREDAFRAAWRLRGLLVAGGEPADDAARRLAALQGADGSWPRAALLRIPPPHVEDPATVDEWILGGRGGRSLVPDIHGVFTTASAVSALARAGARA